MLTPPKLLTYTLDNIIPGVNYCVSPVPVTPALVPESLYNVTSGASEIY
jgi:hypothetical protein